MFELELDPEIANHFKESSRWAKFLSIIYFVAIGLCILAFSFGASAIIGAFGQFTPGFKGAGFFLIAVILIALVIIFVTTLLLYRFAVLTREGIERQDQIVFNKGLQALKNYFIVYGILTLISFISSLFISFARWAN